MKTKLLLSLLFTSLFLLIACSDDDNNNNHQDVDGLPPAIALNSTHIKAEHGRDFYIDGKIEDKDGLKSIHLKCTDISLDKIIDLAKDSIIYTFDLNYKFKVRKDIEGQSFDVQITATDLGGRITEKTLLLTMDGDFRAPVFTVAPDGDITVLVKSETKLNLKFTVEDDKALASVDIVIPEISYNKKITAFTNAGKTLVFSDPLILPAVPATYNLEIVAADKADLKVTKKVKITVSEMPDFAKMYVTSEKDAAKLSSDIFGIPMLIDRIAPYTYKAIYYSEKAGTEIRFIPQKNDFGPICFGVDPSDRNKLADNPEVSEPIVLPAKGYYEINFNVQTAVYTVNTHTPSGIPVPIGSPIFLDGPTSQTIPLEIGLVGGGLPNKDSWNTRDPYPLIQDTTNPFLFTTELTLEKGAIVEFIISAKHNWGWWPEPFWRWDRAKDPEANVSNGGENPDKWEIKSSGKYVFKFDSYLKRSAFYKID